MTVKSSGQMAFPTYTGARCYMMPFIQGRADSLPEAYAGYGDVVERFTLPGQEGELGLISVATVPGIARSIRKPACAKAF